MMLRSVISKLVFYYCLLLVLLGGVFLAVTAISFQHYIRANVTNNLAVRTQATWKISEGVLYQPDKLAQIVERVFSPESENRFVRIRAGKRVLFRSGTPILGYFSPANVPYLDVTNGPRAEMVGDLLLYARQFKDAGGNVITVEHGQSYHVARMLQVRLVAFLLVGLPILIALAALAGYILMRRALIPVEVMIHAAETYTFNDPHKRLPISGTEPRIEALGLALNRMLDRLDNSYSHIRRFSADAAHELRTPLTIMRAELELVATGGQLASDVEKAVGNALEEMTRLSGIVESLITLTRMESVWGKQKHAPVGLRALAEETIGQLNLMADEKDIVLLRPVGSEVVVAGDRDRLKQVLVNLLDNAIKYTPNGGQVRVKIGVRSDRGFFTVEDTGIGIAPAHQERVFDRFYRVAQDRGCAGSGLGLAIVRSICHAHGGSIILRSVLGGGSTFRVDVPLFSSHRDADEPEGIPAGAASDA